MAKFNLIESVKNVLENITGKGVSIVAEVTEKNMLINTGTQDDGTFLDPAYATIGIPCTEIVPQAVNPNYQSEKAFDALLTSISNNGMAFPVLVAENPMYDPSTKGQPKPRCFTGGQDVVDVRDPELRKFYPYTVVDGTHRILSVLYGSPEYRDIAKKQKAVDIYERCHGIVPCVVLRDKTEQELMSAEILFNQARGDHDLMQMKDIVADLARSGMSDQWIAKNLFLEPEAITRFKQLSGMRAAFNTEENMREAWDPVADGVNERRKNINLVQAARRYVRKYRQLAGFDNTVMNDESVNILDAAKNLGWSEENPNEMPKTLDDKGKVFEKELEAEE